MCVGVCALKFDILCALCPVAVAVAAAAWLELTAT